MREPIEAKTGFAEVVADVKSVLLKGPTAVRDWLAESDHDDIICIKNAASVVVATNPAFQRRLTDGQDPIGRHSLDLIDPSSRSASKLSDELVAGPTREIEFVYEARGGDGATYEMRCYKWSLRDLEEPSWAIGMVNRRVARLSQRSPWISLCKQGRYDAFRQLSESDRWVCQQLAQGRSSIEIGRDMGLTRRAIEMRKRKVLDALGLETVADLIRLMVRLHDGGYVDLGL